MNTIISMIKPQAQDSKPKEFLCLFLLLAMSILGAAAQQKNRLYLQDINAIKDHDVSLPVFLENTNQDIVAIQFDLSIASNNIYLIEESAVLSKDRCDDHTLKVVYQRYNKDKLTYTFMLISPTNKPIKANGGEVFSIPVQIPDDIEEEKPFALTLSNVVLSDSKCTNVATGSGDANLTVNPTPDFEVSDIQAHASSFMPGEQMQVSWKVNNIGNADAKGGWRERIWLVSADGYQVNINTSYYDTQSMAQGSTVNRSADITLPNAIGLDGAANIKVELTPNNDSGESYSMKSNNTVQTTDYPVTIGKKLFLLLPDTIAEDAGQVCCELIRSGSKKSGYAFRLEKTGDDRLEIPATVNLPSGQSSAWFYVNTKDNQLTDANSVFTITVTGDGYEAETARMVIADNDHPDLSIKVSKSEVTEGETFQLTVSVSDASHQNPITVSLACEGSKRFSFAKQTVIPVGQTSVTVDVTATDNEEVEQQQSYAFYASAEGYLDSECLVLLNDNDMPQLTFTLSPSAVSEAEGATALLGIIKRTDKLDKRVIFKLSDDNEGLLSYPTNTIVLEKNRSEVQFNIGVNENSSDNGTRQVNVTASVYSSSCDCLVNSLSGNALTATATIIDADGPALSVKSAGTAMQEGSKGNVLTISHNAAAANKDITVTISSDKDDRLSYNHTVTIPAGATSADVLIDVNKNDSEDDSEIVTFRVEADGYAMGTCWLIVTDQSLPDAKVTLRTDKTTVEAGSTIGLTIVVTNLGNATLNSRTPIRINFSGSNNPVNLTVGRRLAPGDSVVIEYNFDLPPIIGQHTFEAIVNASESLAELLFSNNSSGKTHITLTPTFQATVQAEKKQYQQGDSIIIIGNATGSKGNNTNVEVFVINNEIRQTIMANSNSEGNFSAIYKPLPSQAGHFTIGACYPGEELTIGTDDFDIVGLVSQKPFTISELCQTDTYTGKIFLWNPCLFNQSGINVAQKDKSSNCEFNFKIPKQVEAGKSLEIEFTIKGKELSEGSNWQRMPISITTAEGANTDHIIYYYVHPLKAQLKTNKTAISTTMTLGMPREYPITIRNIGRSETGRITLSLPEWIETATPREIASLQQGDSTTIILRFMPTEEMKLNIPISGDFGINCEKGNGTSVSFNITPVSETKGTLKIDVIDEYTYYTEKAPHVKEATVRLTNPSTNEIVAVGKTTDDGIFITELPEGYYSVSIEAEKHNSFNSHLLVSPGVENNEEVFLSYEAITYDWGVVETKIDDDYEIETIAKYETRVPKPVVTISLPREKPAPNSIIPITLTNHGLVHALDVNAWFSVSDGYSLEPLNSTWLDTLQAQQSYVIFAKLIPVQEEAASRTRKVANNCMSIGAFSSNKQPCLKYPERDYSQDIVYYGNCREAGGFGNHIENYQSGDSSAPGSPSGQGISSYSYSHSTRITNGDPSRFCDNGPHRIDDYGPMDRDTVSDEPIPETDCDEKPKLVFKLVPVTGTRYEMLGVAADGVSQVKIVLDPKESHIPAQDCNNLSGFTWQLSKEGYGKIEKISEWEAIYTAPDYFPTDINGTVTSVEAKLVYRQTDPWIPDFAGWLQEVPPVKIEIIRPPVVFIHGLGDSQKCWKYADMFLAGLYYKRDINCKVDYENSNTSTFMSNVGVVSDGIYTAQRNAITQGYMATKCDLIGHSMGGILARLFVERGGRKEDVYRIITVNTPHAGSELGDMVKAHHLLLKPLAQLFYKKVNIDAVEDLGVESEETSLLVDSAGHYDIPVYALGTESLMTDVILGFGNELLLGINKVLLAADVVTIAEAIINPEPVSKTTSAIMAAIITAAASLSATEGQHLLLEDYKQIGPGDLVVSSQSQEGGCKASKIIENGPWHCNSPRNMEVIKLLRDLLITPPNDSTFSTDWFSPRKRNFKHNKWDILNDMALSFIPIIGSAPSVLKNYEFKINFITRIINKSRRMVESQESIERVISADISLPEKMSSIFACVFLNDDLAYFLHDDEQEYVIPATFSGEVKVMVIMKDDKGNLYTDEKVITIDEPLANPVSLEAENISVIAGKTVTPSILCTWDNGTVSSVDANNIVIDNEAYASYTDGKIKGLSAGFTQATVSYAGLTCNTTIKVYPSNSDANSDNADNSKAVCTTVTLSFKQKNVMTRQAFRGTLTINNGDLSNAMQNIKLQLEVRGKEGKLATTHEFQIDAETLDGFDGEKKLDAGWKLAAGSKGTATILFIPTKYAAPTEPQDYSFGGSFSYTDPATGLTVTRDLNPVTLTVNPSPQLELTYFMQRDVIGDDPLTEEVESMEPAEFALLINNKGYGEATNMSLTTQQPQIIDNQKGLAINFQLLSSQLNGQEKTLALGGSMTTDFGTIPAQSQAYAQWWLQSSLLGHFIEYNVNTTHVTSRDNPDLSLLDNVSIHELIHGFTAGNGLRGFLVNDQTDAEDQPDRVYLTDATQHDVAMTAAINISQQNETEWLLTVTPSQAGWNYGVISDPTNSKLKVVKIVRQSDGAELDADNVWLTDRTLRDGKDPLCENRLHFVGNLGAQGDSYLLTFAEKTDTELSIKDLKSVLASDTDNPLSIVISPIPVYDQMHISGDFNLLQQIAIYDMGGIVRLRTGKLLPGQPIDVTKLPAGLYAVNIVTDRGTYQTKILKK